MAAEGGVIRFNYTGDGGFIPLDATHVIVSIRVVPANAFRGHLNIVEVICDENVKRIANMAFACCPSLRRVIMPGVEVVERCAFIYCKALTGVECGKLEIIGELAFSNCESLMSINLPSVKIVVGDSFLYCFGLTDVTFSNKLESLGYASFADCSALKRITIPLKDGIIAADDIFSGCGEKLERVDLVEGVVLHETIAALQLEEWRNDMYGEILSIDQILPTASAGFYHYDMDHHDDGGKARAIRTWIRSVLRKIIHYKAEHQRIVGEAATYLQLALPNDIVMKNVLPFLELPSFTLEFELEEEDD